MEIKLNSNGVQNLKEFSYRKNSKEISKPIQSNYSYSIYNQKNNYKYFNNLSFGFKLKGDKNSHLDYYGANIQEDGRTTFRVYSDKKKVDLQIAPTNDIEYWRATTPEDEKEKNITTLPMKRDGNVFEITPDLKLPEGTFYRFKVEDEQGNIQYLKDPRSYYQPNDTMGWSATYNQNSYKWNDESWQKGLDDRKIKHVGSKNQWGAQSGMVISEKHIGLLGGFEKAKEEIDEVVRDGICNTVYFLPVGEFYGEYNFGYDEVDKFAPESSYGTPDELKSLVDYAHQKGINVILDVVPNHFGPVGSAAPNFADSLEEQDTGWGRALKFNGQKGNYMKKFMADMMMSWLVNYHFDGLRIDATEKLFSDSALQYFASEIRNHPETKDSVLIPEHIDKIRKLAQPLKTKDIEEPTRLFTHNAKELKNSLGYDVQYIYDFKNTLMALGLDMQIYDCPKSIEDLAQEYRQGNRFYSDDDVDLAPFKAENSFVYTNMHDEFNVFGGARPVVRYIAKELGLIREKALTSPDTLDKTPYFIAEELLESYLNKDNEAFEKYGISLKKFKYAYKKAQAKNRLMLGAVFMHPGQKGFSMGDEKGELAPYRFFAQYDNPEIKEQVDLEKGYDIGESAFKKSSKIYNPIKDNQFAETTTAFSRDFAKLIKQNSALSNGGYNEIIAEPIDGDSLFVHRWSCSDDIFAVMNFSSKTKSYNDIPSFPDGIWEEVLNSDDKKYGGENQLNTNLIDRDNQNITLAPYTIAVYKRI